MLENDTKLQKLAEVLAVVLDPSPELGERASDVDGTNRAEWEDAKLMVERMHHLLTKHGQGVAIASPQVGCRMRLVAVNRRHKAFDKMAKADRMFERDPLLMINPRIIKVGGRPIIFDANGGEGCMSIPGLKVVTDTRHPEVTVSYVDIHGNEMTVPFEGLMAVVMQHEIDHLDGIMLWSRVRDPALGIEALHKRMAFQLQAAGGVLPVGKKEEMIHYPMINASGREVITRLMEMPTEALHTDVLSDVAEMKPVLLEEHKLARR